MSTVLAKLYSEPNQLAVIPESLRYLSVQLPSRIPFFLFTSSNQLTPPSQGLKSVGLAAINTNSGSSPCSPNPSVFGLVSFADELNKIHYRSFCLHGNSVVFLGNNVSQSLDVGQNTKVALAYQNSVLVAYDDFFSNVSVFCSNFLNRMEVHDRGFCWNSHSKNTKAAPGLFIFAQTIVLLLI